MSQSTSAAGVAVNPAVPRGPRRFGGAKIRGLEDRTHHALGGDRILPDEIAIASQQTTEILRPGAVHCGVDDHMPDMSGAQFLRLRRKAQESIDVAVDEKLDRFDRRVGDPMDVSERFEANLGGNKGQQHVRGRPEGLHPDALAIQVGDAADAVVSEQFEIADMYTGQQRNRIARLLEPPKQLYRFSEADDRSGDSAAAPTIDPPQPDRSHEAAAYLARN